MLHSPHYDVIMDITFAPPPSAMMPLSISTSISLSFPFHFHCSKFQFPFSSLCPNIDPWIEDALTDGIPGSVDKRRTAEPTGFYSFLFRPIAPVCHAHIGGYVIITTIILRDRHYSVYTIPIPNPQTQLKNL